MLHINFIFNLIFICGSLAMDHVLPSIPHSDCPDIDDINHAVMLPYALDCNKYYSCFKGYAYLQQCPDNLHWSTITYRCDYPEVAKCQSGLLPTLANVENAPATSAALTASPLEETVYQLYPNDCSKYYKCQTFACPSNYYWNSRMQKCDFPHNAECPFSNAINTVKGLNTFPALEIKANMSETFYIPYPSDCSKFYQCESMMCPFNYHWNDRTQQCDLPQLALCPLQTQLLETHETSTAAIPTAFTAPPTPAATTQLSGNDTFQCLDCVQSCVGYLHHYLPHPHDCHKFIQCNGWSFIHTCPDYLYWNAKLNTCDRICVRN